MCIDYNEGLSDNQLRIRIMDELVRKCRDIYISRDERRQIYNSVFNSMRRLDILQPLLEDELITEIMVNGYKDIYVEREGRITKTGLEFSSQERLYEIIQGIVSKVNRIVNESTPIVDARLRDGSRVNVILPPIAINGPILTIRKFSDRFIGINELVQLETMTDEVANLLKRLVKSRYNIFICGGTSSGKTTLLNALAAEIPYRERLIIIEDSAELRVDSKRNAVRLEARMSNTEGRGEISIKQMIKASLRMRPDRIIVGEVRGEEAMDMLQAMNTGHDGSISTGHANSTLDMISRLEAMVLSAYDIPIEAIHKQIASAIDIIIHISKLRDNRRRIVSISELVGITYDKIQFNELYSIDEDDINKESYIPTIKSTGKQLVNRRKLQLNGYKDDI